MYNDMISFFSELLGLLADFLLAEPVRYFTGCAIGACIIGLISRIWHLNRY